MDSHYGLPMEGGGGERGETPKTPMDGGHRGGWAKREREREKARTSGSGGAKRTKRRASNITDVVLPHSYLLEIISG